MSDNGYVKAYRRAWTHPIFRDLLDAAIWNYLYQNASWKESRTFANGTRIDLQRGQIFITLRTLAEGFGCAEARIRRCIDALTGDAMITTLATHRGTVITICNYSAYQGLDIAPDALPAQEQRTDDRRVDTPLIKKNENKKSNEDNTTTGLPDYLDPVLWDAFKEMRKGSKKPMTAYAEKLMLSKLDKLKQQGHDPTLLLEESIRRNWIDIYTPKGNDNDNTGTSTGKTQTAHRGAAGANGPSSGHADPATTARDIGEAIIERRRLERERAAAESQPAGAGRFDAASVPDLFQPKNLR